MSSTGTQSKSSFDEGYIEHGLVLGTKHCYLRDGIWVRCECGSEIMECIQVDLDNPNGFEYQIRCFGGHGMDKTDMWNSCFVGDKTALSGIIEVLESHQPFWRAQVESDSNYWLYVTRSTDENYPTEVSITLERLKRMRGYKFITKHKCVWEIILQGDTPKLLAKKLKEMIKNEEKIFNGTDKK